MSSIFLDKTAAGVRSDLHELIGDGYAGERAAEELIDDYAEILDDPDDGPMFWVGLAAAQLELGHVDQHVREKALEVIASGALLTPRRRPLSADSLGERQAALAELREQLAA
jgi:hypothetical protein